jgi:hypothetical protein
LSGLTFQEWDTSAGSDDTSAPVAMLVNWSELRAADLPLEEVSPLQLDVVSRGDRRTRGAAVRNLQGVGNSTFVLSVKTTMTSGQDVSEFLDTLGLVKSNFSSFLRKKNKKIEKFFFSKFFEKKNKIKKLSNPDMPLSPHCLQGPKTR